ncbi:MAG: hypothetical protein DRR06_20745, partial [Gammaproteobacteria bacterium]
FEESISKNQRNRFHLAGWCTKEELAVYFETSWAQLSPSWFETFGLAALEAMAYGVGVIGTTAGALPELVVNGESGLLSRPRDVDALVTNTVRVLKDGELARSLGRAATKRARRFFPWSKVVMQHLEVYESCLN